MGKLLGERDVLGLLQEEENMENASKAIIMAGGILIGVIILSVLVLVFRPMGDIYTEEGVSLSVEQLEKYK